MTLYSQTLESKTDIRKTFTMLGKDLECPTY